jgi:hypothetical protein
VLAASVLLARQGVAARPGAPPGGRWLTGSGALALRDGAVRVVPVRGWEEKLATLRARLQGTHELRILCAAEQVDEVRRGLAGHPARVVGVRTPDDLLEALDGWVEPVTRAPEDLPRWGLRVAEAMGRAHALAARAGRPWVALRDLAEGAAAIAGGVDDGLAALLSEAPPAAPLPAEPGDPGERYTPAARAVLADLDPPAALDAFGSRLAAALRRHHHRAPALQGSGTGLGGGTGPAVALEVREGPEEGRLLHPPAGACIGRHRRSEGPDLALYVDRTRGVDLAVHGRHLVWDGEGVVVGVRPWEHGPAGVGRRRPVRAGERVHLQAGDEVWLSARTVLLALGAEGEEAAGWRAGELSSPPPSPSRPPRSTRAPR